MTTTDPRPAAGTRREPTVARPGYVSGWHTGGDDARCRGSYGATVCVHPWHDQPEAPTTEQVLDALCAASGSWHVGERGQGALPTGWQLTGWRRQNKALVVTLAHTSGDRREHTLCQTSSGWTS